MGIAFETLTYDADLVPDSGTASIVMQATVRAEGAPPAEVVFLFDAGMVVSGVDVDGVATTPTVTPAGQLTIVGVPVSLGPEGTATITVSYAGVPLCGTYAPGFAFCEAIGGGMSRYQSGSIFPILLEQDGSPTTDVGTQAMVLRLPSGTNLVSNFDPIADADDGTVRTVGLSIAEPRALFAILIPGTFETQPLEGASPSTLVAFGSGTPPWNDTAQAVGSELVAFIQELNGTSFPCATMTFLELQPEHRDVSFSYRCLLGAHPGDVPTGWRFEEFAAHELSHQYWGLALAPSDSLRTKLLHDGAAQLAMYDWAHLRRFPEVPYDDYVGYRAREADIALRYLAPLAAATPVLVASPSDAINFASNGALESWGWEYLKSSAAHDALRVFAGEPFVAARAAFLDACIGVSCDSFDFRDALQTETGFDFSTFFDAFVTGAYIPNLRVGFTVAETSGVFTTTVLLEQDEDRSIPVELLFELEDGQLARSVISLTGTSTELAFEHASPPIVVRPNPRLTPLLRDRSAIEGDIDYDGRVDGVDLVRCSFAHGREARADYPPPLEENLGYFGIDLFFEPRCDFDGDGTIGDLDLDHLRAAIDGSLP